MSLGLGSLLYVILLLINSVAILSEDRFLSRVGWTSGSLGNGFGAEQGFSGPEGPGIKVRLINLITAVRTLLRIPLIAFNIVVIIYELVLG